MAYFKYQCPNCLRTYDTTVGVSECPQCNKQHEVTKDDMPKSGERNLVEDQENVDFYGAIVALRIIAWLNLIGGVLASIICFSLYLSEEMFSDPIFSIALFVGGVCSCVFLLVICSIADSLIGIRKNTKIIKERMIGDKQEEETGIDGP